MGLSQLDRGASIEQVGKAIAKVSGNENIMAADDKGNIGWWHPGRCRTGRCAGTSGCRCPGTGQAEWRGLLKFRADPARDQPQAGLAGELEQLPSVGWTNGDAEATERIIGRLHRAN